MTTPAGRSLDAVLFDLDGTLTDSAPGLLGGIRYALDVMGVDQPDDATMRTFLGPPLWVTFRDHFGMSPTDVQRTIDIYREYYHDQGMFENSVYDGITGTLDSLREAGVRLAVATSKPEYSAAQILDHFDLSQYFEFLGADSLDGSRSAKALVIAHTLENTGLDPSRDSLVMVGDRRHDVEGAAEHGIETIGVLWGYGDHAELSGAGARAIAATPEELTSLLRTFTP